MTVLNLCVAALQAEARDVMRLELADPRGGLPPLAAAAGLAAEEGEQNALLWQAMLRWAWDIDPGFAS